MGHYEWITSSGQHVTSLHAVTNATRELNRHLEVVGHLIAVRNVESVVGHEARAALSQAGLVFIVTALEAFVETLVADAANHLGKHTESFRDLPKPVKQAIVKRVNADKDDLAAGRLAEYGWRLVLREMVDEALYGTASNKKQFNTPRAKNIDDLLTLSIGLRNASASWSWQNSNNENVRARLEELIDKRGDVVHGTWTEPVVMTDLGKHSSFVQKLAARIEEAVSEHVASITGDPLLA